MELKRYVRTKSGKIFDTRKIDIYDIKQFECMQVKTSDNILDLIEVGDLYSIMLLIDMGETITEETYEIANEDDLEDFKECVKNGNIALTKIYTKQGDNYILAARKTEKGWEVL